MSALVKVKDQARAYLADFAWSKPSSIPQTGNGPRIAVHIIPQLGKLSQVDPRKVWSHEAHSFTPWLALAENLAILGEALGFELELEAVEQAVGPFRADILCKRVGSNHWVLIENQLERTDHSHLGQVLTYAAGLEAVTVVWISPQFTEEHRACLDWLNRSTIKGLNFFGVQMEVWKIGDSQMAPRFHLVSQPNDWAESVSEASVSIGKPETLQTHLEYWFGFREAMVAKNGNLKAGKPQAENWSSLAPFGKSDFMLMLATNKLEKRIRAQLYITGQLPHAYFLALKQHRSQLEQDLGPLIWKESAAKDRTITQFLDSTDPTDKDDWGRQHAWLVERLYAFYRAFSPIIATLQPVTDEDGLSVPDAQ